MPERRHSRADGAQTQRLISEWCCWLDSRQDIKRTFFSLYLLLYIFQRWLWKMLVTETTQARESNESSPFLICPVLWIFVHFIRCYTKGKVFIIYHAFQRYCLWAHRAIISSGIFIHKWPEGEERNTYRQRTGGRRRDKQDVTHLRQVHSCSRLQRRHHTEDTRDR